jgi:hypothetical protein
VALGVYCAYFGFCFLAAAFHRAAYRGALGPRRRAGIQVALALVAGPCLLLLSEPPEWLSDFRKAYYAAGGLVRHDPAAMYGQDELRFVNLPVLALPFSPLAALPLRPAKWVFTLTGLAAVAAAWWMLVGLTGARGQRRAALAALFVLCGPLYYSVREGNLTHFLLPVLVAALIALERRRDVWLGVLTAAAGLVKPPLLLLGGYLLYKQRWRAVAAAAAALALAAGSSLALFGPALHRTWYDRCIGPYAAGPMSAYNVQSAGAFLARLLTAGELDGNWRPVAAGASYQALHLLMLAVLAGAVWMASRRPPGPDQTAAERLEFCAVLCLALLVSPVSWTHYYLLLLIPFGIYVAGGLPAGTRHSAVALGLALALVSPPVIRWPSQPGPARLLASHYFMGGVLLLGVLAAARWRSCRAPADHAPGISLRYPSGKANEPSEWSARWKSRRALTDHAPGIPPNTSSTRAA